MAIQIADSMIDQVDRSAHATGLVLTAKTELALALWLSEMSGASDQSERMAARMAQLDDLSPDEGSSQPVN